MMKTVLCYGDSNTYGYNPVNGLRYPDDIRWTGRLQKMLGPEYKVIEEGCNGRTTVLDDPEEPWKNGMSYLRACLNTHKPVDIVILMLGSNDLKKVFHASAEQIAGNAGQLTDVIIDFTSRKQSFRPEIILVSPTRIGETISSSPFSMSFDDDSIKASISLSGYYRQIAEDRGCHFVNAAELVEPSPVDALHWTEDGHKVFAERIGRMITEELKGEQ